MDFSSSISQLGQPGTSDSGSATSSSRGQPASVACFSIFQIILSRVILLIRGSALISSIFIRYFFCCRWTRPPACSHTHARMVADPAPLALAAREISANQNFRLSAMDSFKTVPSSSVHSSSGLTMMPFARRSTPAASATAFQMRCIGSMSIRTIASPFSTTICSAKDRAPFMARVVAPTPGVSAKTMTLRCQQPRASSFVRSCSASSLVRQTQMLAGGPAAAFGPLSTAMRSGHRCSLSFFSSVPCINIVWPRPTGTEKSIPSTPVKRD
mmetsp:Transcript_95348/g.246432  ORF Transcript_95348/g.246432 Transcript_95348/m.246432 type:complete len:270 (-) Transcript_95348:585-1394(-)